MGGGTSLGRFGKRLLSCFSPMKECDILFVVKIEPLIFLFLFSPQEGRGRVEALSLSDDHVFCLSRPRKG